MVHFLIKFDIFYENYNCHNLTCEDYKRSGYNNYTKLSLNTDITRMEDGFFKKVITEHLNGACLKRFDVETGEVLKFNKPDWVKIYN